jgi:hypothetical protein
MNSGTARARMGFVLMESGLDREYIASDLDPKCAYFYSNKVHCRSKPVIWVLLIDLRCEEFPMNKSVIMGC